MHNIWFIVFHIIQLSTFIEKFQKLKPLYIRFAVSFYMELKGRFFRWLMHITDPTQCMEFRYTAQRASDISIRNRLQIKISIILFEYRCPPLTSTEVSKWHTIRKLRSRISKTAYSILYSCVYTVQYSVLCSYIHLQPKYRIRDGKYHIVLFVRLRCKLWCRDAWHDATYYVHMKNSFPLNT